MRSSACCATFCVRAHLFLGLSPADVMKGYNGTVFSYGQTGSGASFPTAVAVELA